MTRRETLGSAPGLGAAIAAKPVLGANMFPIVETAQGKLRGLLSSGISIFRGISYAADTSGKNRFMPPQPLENWAGVRDALHWGDVAPQIPGNRRHTYADLIMVDRNPSGMGEDNLSLNLWTPEVNPNAKKPVIVVLHGGGFYSGSGNSVGMDGEQMARFSDCVVIAINHRLGAFGFLHLGQSGGGAKTSTLLAMPKGKGLFQRAGVMSGSALRMMPAEMASRTAKRLFDALEIGKGDIGKLQQVPWTLLLETQAKLEAGDRARGEAPRSFAPVVDGIALPRHPWDPDAPDVSADVPMIISSTLDERSYRMIDFNMNEAELLEFAEKKLGDKAQEAVAAYREEDAKATSFVLAARLDSDLTFGRGAFAQAELKAKQGGAKVWKYLWTQPSPAVDGRYGAVHGIDVAPSLYNTRDALNGSSRKATKLAAAIASSWAAFAANGDPNNGTKAWRGRA